MRGILPSFQAHLALLVALLAAGCGEETSAARSTAAVSVAQERAALDRQLAGMSPEQQGEYIRQHPDAQRVLSGAPAQGSKP